MCVPTRNFCIDAVPSNILELFCLSLLIGILSYENVDETDLKKSPQMILFYLFFKSNSSKSNFVIQVFRGLDGRGYLLGLTLSNEPNQIPEKGASPSQ
jgi:hypothetical protein